jgi:hypothetical protein
MGADGCECSCVLRPLCAGWAAGSINPVAEQCRTILSAFCNDSGDPAVINKCNFLSFGYGSPAPNCLKIPRSLTNAPVKEFSCS